MSINKITRGFAAVAISTYMALTTTDLSAQATTPAIQKVQKEKIPKTDLEKPSIVLFYERDGNNQDMGQAIKKLKTINPELRIFQLERKTIEEKPDSDPAKKQMQAHITQFPSFAIVANQKIIATTSSVPEDGIESWILATEQANKNKQAFDNRGNKSVVIDFYMDACPPCKKLKPQMEQLSQQWQEGLVLIINEKNIAHYSDHPIGIFFDNGSRAFPTIIGVNAQGNIQFDTTGTTKNYNELRTGINTAFPSQSLQLPLQQNNLEPTTNQP